MRERKQKERHAALARLRLMSADARNEAQEAIAESFFALVRPEAGAEVMFYVSFDQEVATGEMIRRMLDAGANVSAGRCVPESRRLDAVRIRDFDRDLEPGYAGIPEPGAGLEVIAPERLSVVVVPLVAFGADCARLGRGQGFYDRFLARLKPDCLKAGLAFECQKSDTLPAEGHDVRLDVIVTEKRIYKSNA